jgi:hypothetical protein
MQDHQELRRSTSVLPEAGWRPVSSVGRLVSRKPKSRVAPGLLLAWPNGQTPWGASLSTGTSPY